MCWQLGGDRESRVPALEGSHKPSRKTRVKRIFFGKKKPGAIHQDGKLSCNYMTLGPLLCSATTTASLTTTTTTTTIPATHQLDECTGTSTPTPLRESLHLTLARGVCKPPPLLPWKKRKKATTTTTTMQGAPPCPPAALHAACCICSSLSCLSLSAVCI